jgi:hypothetical protein
MLQNPDVQPSIYSLTVNDQILTVIDQMALARGIHNKLVAYTRHKGTHKSHNQQLLERSTGHPICHFFSFLSFHHIIFSLFLSLKVAAKKFDQRKQI